MSDTRHCNDPMNIRTCEDYGPSDILVSCFCSSVEHTFGIFLYFADRAFWYDSGQMTNLINIYVI